MFEKFQGLFWETMGLVIRCDCNLSPFRTPSQDTYGGSSLFMRAERRRGVTGCGMTILSSSFEQRENAPGRSGSSKYYQISNILILFIILSFDQNPNKLLCPAGVL